VQQVGIKYHIFPPTNFDTRGDPWGFGSALYVSYFGKYFLIYFHLIRSYIYYYWHLLWKLLTQDAAAVGSGSCQEQKAERQWPHVDHSTLDQSLDAALTCNKDVHPGHQVTQFSLFFSVGAHFRQGQSLSEMAYCKNSPTNRSQHYSSLYESEDQEPVFVTELSLSKTCHFLCT